MKKCRSLDRNLSLVQFMSVSKYSVFQVERLVSFDVYTILIKFIQNNIPKIRHCKIDWHSLHITDSAVISHERDP